MKRYYRKPKTTNEKRQSIEHKKYIRPKRKMNNLVDSYYDKPICRQKNWKSKTKKRKQYLKG